MPEKIKLKTCQRKAVDTSIEALANGESGFIVAPTGSGKSYMMSAIRGHFPAQRSLFLQAQRTIAGQNETAVLTGLPEDSDRSITRYNAEEKDLTGHTIFATELALLKGFERQEDIPFVDLLFIDECHHAAADGYQQIIDQLREVNPNLVRVGVTATDFRGDNKDLAAAMGGGRLAAITRKEAIDQDLIVPTTVRTVDLGLDERLKALESTSADVEIAGGRLLNTPAVNERMVETWEKCAAKRRTVAFTTSPDHARALAECFEAKGYMAKAIDGNTPEAERQKAYRDLEEGRLHVITNCMVVTEGVNLPSIDCILLARGRAHPGLYLQIVGRGARWEDGKMDNLVLDFGRSSHDFARLSTNDPELACFDTIQNVEEFMRRAMIFAPRETPPDIKLLGEISELSSLEETQATNAGRIVRLSNNCLAATDGEKIAFLVSGEEGHYVAHGKISWCGPEDLQQQNTGKAALLNHSFASLSGRKLHFSACEDFPTACQRFRVRLGEMETTFQANQDTADLAASIPKRAGARNMDAEYLFEEDRADEGRLPERNAARLAALCLDSLIGKQATDTLTPEQSRDFPAKDPLGLRETHDRKALAALDAVAASADANGLPALSSVRANKISLLPENLPSEILQPYLKEIASIAPEERGAMLKRTRCLDGILADRQRSGNTGVPEAHSARRIPESHLRRACAFLKSRGDKDHELHNRRARTRSAAAAPAPRPPRQEAHADLH